MYMYMCSSVTVYVYNYMRNHLLSVIVQILHTIEMLLSLLVETGQRPGTGLTQADKTCIQLNFYLKILKGGHLGFKGGGGGGKPPSPPKCNPEVYDYAVFFTD